MRALLAHVPLGPRPWLHRLRGRATSGFVRRLHCYYGEVRLLGFVHHRLRLLAFPARTGSTPPAKPKISRFPYKKLPRMPGSSTTPGRPDARHSAPVRVAFHVSNRVGIRDMSLSQLNGWPARSPVNASLSPSRMPAHDSGPLWFARPSVQRTCTTYSLPVLPAHLKNSFSGAARKITAPQTRRPFSDAGDHAISCCAQPRPF